MARHFRVIIVFNALIANSHLAPEVFFSRLKNTLDACSGFNAPHLDFFGTIQVVTQPGDPGYQSRRAALLRSPTRSPSVQPANSHRRSDGGHHLPPLGFPP